MTTKGKLLQVNIKIMQFLNMWPRSDEIEPKLVRMLKDFTGYINVFLGMLTAIADLIIQLNGYDDILDMTENLTAAGALFGSLYMGICFILNRKQIMKLVHDLVIFEQFCSADKIMQTERKSRFVTKLFVIYGVIGNLIYVAVPYTNLNECKKKRAHYKYSPEMPCELITRFRIPFRYEDKQWKVHTAVVWQLFICLNATVITLTITMFIVAFLIQVIAQLQELRLRIRENDKPFREYIRYHIAIIGYSSSVSKAFSSTMLMYITLTSFQISVLGFEVLMVTTITDSIRYAMHLLGWLVLLYLVCSYGQQLIDESKAIGWEAYSIPWYEKSVSEQKDLKLMILRSQKPLVLTAASLGTLSLEAFLSVLSTAYSYFTLLLNMKDG